MAMQRPGTNYYEILEVSPDAPQNEIHRAYQKAKQTYSQDNPALYSMFSKEEARELTRMIEEAYQVLGNQSARLAYDQSTRQTGSAPEASVPAMPPFSDATLVGSETLFDSAKAQPAANHDTLPDFSLPESESAGGEFIVRKRESAKTGLPNGQGRTSLSTYKIDDAMESEIAAREEWDGPFIARVRAYKNVSLDKLSDATRVSRGYLSAVEMGDWKNLPAPVFVRGFVAQTARILGLDEAKVATSYMKLLKVASGAKK